MHTYIRITEKTMHWFLPLLSEEEILALQSADAMAYAIGAVSDKTACGVLVFHMRGEIAEITYLAVSDAFRRKGIATGMIRYLCQFAWDSITPIICTFAAADQKDEIYQLFHSMENFSIQEEDGFYCHIPFAEMADAPLAAIRKGNRRYQEFFSLPLTERRCFYEELLSRKVYYLKEIKEEEYEKPLCLCAVADGKIKAAVFVKRCKESEEDLELCCAWCEKGRQKDMIGILLQAFEMLPKDRKGALHIAAVIPVTKDIVEYLLPERKIAYKFYCAAWDMEK